MAITVATLGALVGVVLAANGTYTIWSPRIQAASGANILPAYLQSDANRLVTCLHAATPPYTAHLGFCLPRGGTQAGAHGLVVVRYLTVTSGSSGYDVLRQELAVPQEEGSDPAGTQWPVARIQVAARALKAPPVYSVRCLMPAGGQASATGIITVTVSGRAPLTVGFRAPVGGCDSL